MSNLAEIFSRIPEPEKYLLFLKCPRCGDRVWNRLFTTELDYQIHYLGHIQKDLEADERQ